MASYRFTPRERLELLAAYALDVLDEEFSEAELDRDDNPPRTDLYNLAAAITESRPDDADELLTGLVEFHRGEENGAVARAVRELKVGG